MRYVLILLIGFCLTPALVAQEDCPHPQHEYCDANRGTTEFTNCLARNRQEDNRHEQCLAEVKREKERERREQEKERQEEEREQKEQAHKRFCKTFPDSDKCK
jgi:hypothetical protein